MAEAALQKLSRAAGGLAAGVFTVSQCLYNVDGGERAVMFDSLRGGILPKVLPEGTHFMIPVVQRPVVIDVRSKPREIPSVTGTKDLQMVNLTLRVLWRPVVEELEVGEVDVAGDVDVGVVLDERRDGDLDLATRRREQHHRVEERGHHEE